jgi:hypothetical protein
MAQQEARHLGRNNQVVGRPRVDHHRRVRTVRRERHQKARTAERDEERWLVLDYLNEVSELGASTPLPARTIRLRLVIEHHDRGSAPTDHR